MKRLVCAVGVAIAGLMSGCSGETAVQIPDEDGTYAVFRNPKTLELYRVAGGEVYTDIGRRKQGGFRFLACGKTSATGRAAEGVVLVVFQLPSQSPCKLQQIGEYRVLNRDNDNFWAPFL